MRETLIGRRIRVIDSKNKSLVGIEGRVIDETKNTIKIIDKKNKEKTLVKKQITFELDSIVVEGEKIAKRIEERIKR